MSKVFFDMSVSLDGFIAGPNDGPENGLGDGGERLHEWIYGLASWRERHGLAGGSSGADDDLLEEAFAGTGAAVMGKRMFDVAVDAWGDDPPFHMPVYVVTHEDREPLERAGGTTFHFVTGGVEAAVDRARESADGRDVSLAGGADVIQQALAAGLIDEFQLHLVPILLGGGVRLFGGGAGPELERTRVIESEGVTHLRFRVPR